MSALAGEANEVESLLAGTEAELAALGDPRGRTVLLNQIIASRAERYRETEQANSLSQELSQGCRMHVPHWRSSASLIVRSQKRIL